MSPCRQNGLLRFGSSILPPLSFQIGVSCPPLTCRREQLTLKFFDIDVRSRPAISGGGEELASETLCRRLQNCIRAGLGHSQYLRERGEARETSSRSKVFCCKGTGMRTAMPRSAAGSPRMEPVLPSL